MEPKLEEMAVANANVVFLNVDVDECGETAKEYEVNAMPTIKFFKDGKVFETVVGAHEAKIKKLIADNFAAK